MKKIFTAPEVQISKFAQRDIITTSGGEAGGNGNNPTGAIPFRPGQGGTVPYDPPTRPIEDPEDFV